MSSTRRLNLDYVYHFESLARFFSGNPASPEAWREAIARAQDHPRARDEIVSVLLVQQAARETPRPAREAAERLRDPSSVAIVTGQQAGLFGGPLYTLLKAVAAVRLAEQVTREHGVPAVALFWIDAEDHDWDEVSACQVLDQELAPQRVALADAVAAGERPVAEVKLPPSVRTVIDALRVSLPPTEFTETLLADLSASYRPGLGMAAAFGRWLERLLGPHGLVVFDGADPHAKPLTRRLFEHEIETIGRASDLAATAGEALAALGYHAQVTPHRGQPALFHLAHRRQPIRQREGVLTIDETVRSREALLDEVRRDPARFSPNVLLRPIVQDTLFPTAAYLAGPSELAYLGQLRDVYAHFGVPMPLMVPRTSATILDSAGSRFLTRYELGLDDLRAQDEGRLNRLLEAQLPRAVEDGFSGTLAALDERLAVLGPAVATIDPTLEGAARTTLTKMDRELHTLHNKVIQAAKRRNETLRRQFTRTRAQTFPSGQPQERALGSVYFLNRYGPALVDQLRSDLPLDARYHWVLTP